MKQKQTGTINKYGVNSEVFRGKYAFLSKIQNRTPVKTWEKDIPEQNSK